MMGCPNEFYKRALQYFAYCLTYTQNKKLAKKWGDEDSIEKLEEYIKKKKSNIGEECFFFDAGRTYENILQDADENGCDSFNACIAGLIEFKKFIGIK